MSARSQQGFSLLEVLVAFVITAASLAVIFQIMGKGTRALALGRDYSRAIALAESTLVLAALPAEAGGATTGNTDGFRWRAMTTPAPALAEHADVQILPLQQITNEVTWQDRGHDRVIQITTLRPLETP